MAAPSIPAKFALLREQISDGLSKTLADETRPNEQSMLRSQFQRHAQDYQTLILMDLLPDYALAALNAYQSVDKDATDSEARQWLLALLRDSYYAALESRPIETNDQHQH